MRAKGAKKGFDIALKWRSNHKQYKFLNTQSPFSQISDEIHPLLQQSLEANNYEYMTRVQLKAVKSGILEGKNMLIRGGNGTGKTLTYLLPILNNMYHD